MTFIQSILHLYRPGLWPPTTNLWAAVFAVLVAAILLLGYLWRGRLVVLGTVAVCAGLIVVVLVRTDAALALVTVIWLTALAAALGTVVLRFMGAEKAGFAVEVLAFATLLGYGVLALVAGVLALAGLLNRTAAWLVLCCLTLLLVRSSRTALATVHARLRRVPAWWSGADFRWSGRAAALFGVIAVFPFLWALAPSVHWDALASHFPVSSAYASVRGFSTVSGYWYSYFSGQTHLLYALAFALVGQPLPGLMHFVFGGITTILVFALAHTLAGRAVAWIAAIAFASMPVVGWEAGTAYIDLFVTAYTFGSLAALLRWLETRSRGLLLISGAMGGMAVGTKLSAVLMLAPAAFYISLVIIRSARGRRALSLAATYGLPLVLIPLPWFIRNWVWTHNPVYPMMGSVFGNPELAGFGVNWSHFGRGHGILDFLRLPWDLVFYGPAYDEAGYFAFGMVPLAAVLGIWAVPRKWRYTLLYLLLSATASWFIVGQVSRYLLPIMPLAAVVASCPLSRVGELRCTRLGSAALLAAAATGTIYCAICLGYRSLWNYNLPEAYPYKYALGFENSDAFLTRALRVYPALKYISEHRSPSSRVFSPVAQIRTYVDAPLDDPVYMLGSRQLVSMPAGAALADEIRRRGYDYILVDRPLIRPEFKTPYQDAEFLRQHTRLAFAQGNVYVYRLRRAGEADSGSARELVKNGGFDELEDSGRPRAWESFGSPRVMRVMAHPRGAQSPAFARVTQSDGFYQRAPAKPLTVYTVALKSRADSPGQSAWLQVLWLDSSMTIIDTGITDVSVGSAWQAFEASFTSPAAVAFVQVYARAAAGSTVDIDDVRLIESVQ